MSGWPVPDGYRFDPFADVRLGISLMQMRPEDWLVPVDPTTDEPASSPSPNTPEDA